MAESIWRKLAQAEADAEAVAAGEPMETPDERRAREAHDTARAAYEAALQRAEALDRALLTLNSEWMAQDNLLRVASDPAEIIALARQRATAIAAANEVKAWANHASEQLDNARRAMNEAAAERENVLASGLERELEPLRGELDLIGYSAGVMTGPDREAARENVKKRMAAVRAKWARKAERQGVA